MLSSTLNLVIIAVAALPGFGSASPVENSVQANSGCTYTVSHRIIAGMNQGGPIKPVNAPTLAKCVEKCDNHPRCANAYYDADTNDCQLYLYLGYPASPTRPGTKDEELIRIVPNSCEKPVATPTPFVCTDRIVTVEGGCKFQVKCNMELKGYLLAGSFATLRKSPRDCATKAMKVDNSVGFQWYQGGQCQIAAKPKYSVLNTQARPRSEVWQLIEGSCST